jgi:alpha-L-arabinofuranosidase
MMRLSLIAFSLFAAGWLQPTVSLSAQSTKAHSVLHDEPLHGGRINPMLFGNFIELLDDVVPSMWAEMLNDRSFEGIVRAANWCYFDGRPDFCDREWDRSDTWYPDPNNAFSGKFSARLTATHARPASLTQTNLSVQSGMRYECSGYFRTDNLKLKATAMLKALAPDGRWLVLASSRLPTLSERWKKQSVQLISCGQTDRAAFELRVEGQGRAWVDKLSLMPDDNLRGWRRDVVASVRDVRPAVLRWGGSTCDPGAYRWKSGIGDRDRRTPFRNRVWGRIDLNDVGIDEFCQFCELAGAQPLICLSFSDGPQSAADLVEYCNGGSQTTWGAKRAANGHTSPYGVNYWQVGNEISGDDENYLKSFELFVQSMKRADPMIRLMASFPTQKLLDRVGQDITYIGPHHYTPDFAECDRDFINLARIIDTTPGCAQIRMAVTEWNVSAGDWGLGRGRLMTLGGALLNARYLHVLMRHSDKVEIACRSNLANSFGSGIFETSASGLLKRPSYHVMRLYAHHAKPIPLELDASPEGLDVFACAADDKRSVTVFAVNPGSEPLEWSFESVGTEIQAVSAEMVCDTLDQRQPDVMNHWETPNRVSTVSLTLSENKLILPAFSVTAIECRQ